MKNRNFLIPIGLFIILITGCGENRTPTLLPPTITETVIKSTSTPANTVTPTITITPTITTTPTPEPKTLLPENFSFPVTFDGIYALKQPLRYAPCYHWSGNYNANKGNWYDYFHAGDMHNLNVSNTQQNIVVLSPINGVIKDVIDYGDSGLMIVIQSDYVLDGKRVFVDIGHLQHEFPGDESYPQISVGSVIKQGQPIGVSDKFFNNGRLEQIVDIAIRNGVAGANPQYDNFSPDSYIDPFLYLQDDISVLKKKGFVTFDYFRAHCLKSGHLP